MLYSAYAATDAYKSKQPGAGVRIVIFKGSETKPLIGHCTGISARDDFEQLPVEEAGEDGVNEIVTGRHSGSGSTTIFFTPERHDVLPSRANFLESGNGVEYTILVQTGNRRVGTETNGDGIVFDAFTGCKIQSYTRQVGARGLITGELAFVFEDRKNGLEWAQVSGNV